MAVWVSTFTHVSVSFSFFFQNFYRMVEHLFSISCLREDGTLDSRYKYILCSLLLLLLLLLFISFLPVSNG